MVNGTHPSLPDLVSGALFRIPARRLPDALGRLPPGRLWRACLPGMDPEAALRILGADAAPVLADAARAWSGGDGEALAAVAGLPFAVDTADDLAVLGDALLADARALAAPVPDAPGDDGGREPAGQPPGPFPSGILPPGLAAALGGREAELVRSEPGIWGIEIVHRGRAAWESAALLCLDHAAAMAFAGVMPDAVDALLRPPGGDMACEMRGGLFPLVPLADADSRLRFVEALADAAGPGDPMARFRRSPFRRSAAAGLTLAVAAALGTVRGGTTGRDADGWPVWWRASARDPGMLAAALPAPVAAAAEAVRIGVPEDALDNPIAALPSAAHGAVPGGASRVGALCSDPEDRREHATRRRFALVLTPDEAALLIDGWPPGAWLVAAEDVGGPRWDAGDEADLPAMVGRLPVWPPLGSFHVARMPAEAEAMLLRRLTALPGLAEAARTRLAAPQKADGAEDLSADDIDWDD